jgi:hypothetical protein
MAGSRLTSQEYIEQMRARRQTARAQVYAAQTQPTAEETPEEQVPLTTHPVTLNQESPLPESLPTQPQTTTPTTTTSETYPEPSSSLFIPEEVVLEWTAPNRPFKKRDRQFYVTVIAIVFLVSLILFFAGQLLFIAVIIAGTFLLYVLSSIPPENVHTQITTFGVRTDNELYSWDQLGRFWFDQKFGQNLLHVEIDHFPHRLSFVLSDVPQEEIASLLSEVLIQQTPEPTFIDKATEWIQRTFPLESSSSTSKRKA